MQRIHQKERCRRTNKFFSEGLAKHGVQCSGVFHIYTLQPATLDVLLIIFSSLRCVMSQYVVEILVVLLFYYYRRPGCIIWCYTAGQRTADLTAQWQGMDRVGRSSRRLSTAAADPTHALHYLCLFAEMGCVCPSSYGVS